MLKKLEIIPVYIITAIFLGFNIFFCAQGQYEISLIPLGLATVLFSFFALDKLLIIIAFFTPLSVELKEIVPHLSFNVSLPTEPLLLTATFIFFIKLFYERKFDKKILTHPITIVIYIYLFWIFFTSILSTMPMVSFKFLFSKIWFIVCYYFIVTQIAAEKKNIKNYILAYTLGLLIVVIATLIEHAQYNFEQKPANWVCSPFYKDHTSYGAALAFILPGIIAIYKLVKKDFNIRFFYIMCFVIISIGLVFSFTRGAWGGIAAIIGIWVLIKLKISMRNMIFIGSILILFFLPFKNEIIYKLSKNKEVSSTDISSHVKSMSNISTDASNLERLNRWSCAYRMFLEKPVFGWGPGTYMFKYAPFQLAKERTIISTNAASNGNAHSDYLGPLSETGLFGPISYIAIIITTLLVGFKVYYKSQDPDSRHIALFLLLGLITYYLHGIINNFLDTDKISALFWGYTAIIVALDVYHSNPETKRSENIIEEKKN